MYIQHKICIDMYTKYILQNNKHIHMQDMYEIPEGGGAALLGPALRRHGTDLDQRLGAGPGGAAPPPPGILPIILVYIGVIV